MSHLEQSLLELIRRAACELTQDVLAAVERARKGEDPESNARLAMDLVRESVGLATEHSMPLAPDPLFAHFFVHAPPGFDFVGFRATAEAAVAEAAKKGYITTDFVDPAGGRPVRAGVGPGHPAVHCFPEDRATAEVRLILDASIDPGPRGHYVLPHDAIGAARNLSGVRRAALDAFVREQGSGTGPGVLAIGIGGDVATSGALAHEQLLRPLNDRSRTKNIADLEARILEDANSLGIGPMGFGGKNALLAVKVGAQLASAATFHVSICYQGWALRRQGIELAADGSIAQWLFDSGSATPFVAPEPPARGSGVKAGVLSASTNRRPLRQLLANDDDSDDDSDDSYGDDEERSERRPSPRKSAPKASPAKVTRPAPPKPSKPSASAAAPASTATAAATTASIKPAKSKGAAPKDAKGTDTKAAADAEAAGAKVAGGKAKGKEPKSAEAKTAEPKTAEAKKSKAASAAGASAKPSAATKPAAAKPASAKPPVAKPAEAKPAKLETDAKAGSGEPTAPAAAPKKVAKRGKK
ncbi:MAG: fumarate hydratase [Planctomycetota bacterium]